MDDKNYEQEDYVQSANSLFNFMKEQRFLEESLIKKALCPRYCKEDIRYLNLVINNKEWDEIAVLQKCFCDIPLSKLTQKFALKLTNNVDETFSGSEKQSLTEENTHTDFYGEYGIAFSKKWGEDKGLQPIQYINEESSYMDDFSALINSVLQSDESIDLVEKDILNRLAFIKPIRGAMKRTFKSGGKEVEFYKNFHDEKEWRFVPSEACLYSLKLSPVIANPYLIKKLNGKSPDEAGVNDSLSNEMYAPIWLQYDYEDIRYLIVPDKVERIDLIRFIQSLPIRNFKADSDIELQKDVLISKILVLDEIGKDD